MVRLPVGGTTWLLTYNVTPILAQLLGTVTFQRKVAVCPRGTGRGVLESVPRKSARHTTASSSTSGGGAFDSARAGEACNPPRRQVADHRHGQQLCEARNAVVPDGFLSCGALHSGSPLRMSG
jgi:hypothetical protein